MKSYIIRIELEGSKPLIWRRVIMPADATFRRLHDVIQTVTNFKSGYPYSGYYHLYQFDLSAEDKIVTNDAEYELTDLEVRNPKGLKIDAFLEKYKSIIYEYDFGDGWQFIVKLEKIVDDYYFGFPTLLDGANSAPPEDVGGLGGFDEFLKAYRNPKHPNHEGLKFWGDSQEFREYDPVFTNDMLKHISYKKTEWNKVNHKNYKIIDDKYRK